MEVLQLLSRGGIEYGGVTIARPKKNSPSTLQDLQKCHLNKLRKKHKQESASRRGKEVNTSREVQRGVEE
jgi:hypothetical protein